MPNTVNYVGHICPFRTNFTYQSLFVHDAFSYKHTPSLAYYTSDCRAIEVPLRLVLSQVTNIYMPGDYWRSSRQFHRISCSCLSFSPLHFTLAIKPSVRMRKALSFARHVSQEALRCHMAWLKLLASFVVMAIIRVSSRRGLSPSGLIRVFACFLKVEVLLALKGLHKRMRKVLHLLGKHFLKKLSYICFLKRSLFECLNTVFCDCCFISGNSIPSQREAASSSSLRRCLVPLHSSPPLHPLHCSSPRQSSNFWLLSTLILYNHPTLILIAAACDSFLPWSVYLYIIFI